MTSTMTQLRAIIAADAAPMADRREAARHLTALKTSAVDLTIASDDPEYVRLRTPWERKTASDAELFDLPCFAHLSNGLSHEDAVTRCLELRVFEDRRATWQNSELHRLERLAAIEAYLEDRTKPNCFSVNGYGPERLLATYDAKGNFDFATP